MTKTIAVYPGTFDPLTRGHEDLVRRAATIFGKVIVAIAASEKKRPLFTLEERIKMAGDVLASCPNVEVKGFDCLTMDFVRQQGGNIIMRGLRAVSDFEYEFQLAGMNRDIYPDVETIFLTPGPQYMFISSSMVREIANFGGDVSKFVPALVAKCLKNKYVTDRGN